MKLNRVFILLMLCVGLIVAGAPAMACCAEHTPAHDCCPNGPQPTTDQSAGIEATSVTYTCCPAAQTDLVTTNVMTARPLDSDWSRPEPALSLTFLAALSTVHSLSEVSDISAISPFVASQSPLYLLTGRLRL